MFRNMQTTTAKEPNSNIYQLNLNNLDEDISARRDIESIEHEAKKEKSRIPPRKEGTS